MRNVAKNIKCETDPGVPRQRECYYWKNDARCCKSWYSFQKWPPDCGFRHVIAKMSVFVCDRLQLWTSDLASNGGVRQRRAKRSLGKRREEEEEEKKKNMRKVKAEEDWTD